MPPGGSLRSLYGRHEEPGQKLKGNPIGAPGSKQPSYLAKKEQSEPIRSLVGQHLYYLPQDLSDWIQASYEKNPANPENLKVWTVTGEFVRSKAERAICSGMRTYLRCQWLTWFP